MKQNDKNNDVDSVVSVGLYIVCLSIILIIISYCLELPEFLFKQYDENGNELKTNVNGEFFKFFGLIGGGLIALWGLWINNKRANAQVDQIKLQTEQIRLQQEAQQNMIKQIKIADNSQINTRFKDATMLLTERETSANLSGIYILHQIAEELYSKNPNDGYIKIIQDILCSFYRENAPMDIIHNKPNINYTNYKKKTIVYQTLIDVLFKNERKIYVKNRFELYNSSFKLLNFENANIENANFGASYLEKNLNFKNATFLNVNFKNAIINTMIINVDFTGTIFENANFDELTQGDNSMIFTHPNRVKEWAERRKKK